MASCSTGSMDDALWDQEVTEVDILDIVEVFLITDLENVCTHLGIKNVKLRNARLKDSDRYPKNVLHDWHIENGKKATRSAFKEAVDKCRDCVGAMDSLKKKWTMRQSELEKKRKDETHADKETPLIDQELEAFKSELIEHYKRDMALFPLWLKEARHIDDIFVDMELAKKKKKIENYEDLVILKPLNKVDKYAKRVLVLGDAGSGKTSLMSKIAYSWSLQNHLSLSQFELVFHLRMRDLHSCNKAKSDCSLLGEVFQQMPQTKVNRIIVEKYIEDNPQKILVLLDGWDESVLGHVDLENVDVHNVQHDIENLLNGYKQPSSCVIVTSRPYKPLGKLVEAKYTDINLKGFSNDKVKEYIRKFFHEKVESERDPEGASENVSSKDSQMEMFQLESDKERVEASNLGNNDKECESSDASQCTYSDEGLSDSSYETAYEYSDDSLYESCDEDVWDGEMEGQALDLYQQLKSSHTLESLAKIPVMLMLICWIWQQYKHLPEQQTNLYYQFVRAIWDRYCRREKDHGDERKELMQIGEIAFKGIKAEMLVFKEHDMKELSKTGVNLGLLIEKEHIVDLRIETSVSFLHKSFQEYCAAYFLVNNPDVLDNFLESLDNWDVVLSKQEVLLFCCGLCNKFPGNDAAVNIIKHAIACCIKYGTENECSKVQVGNETWHTRAQYNILPVLNLLNECGHFNHEALNKPLMDDLIMFNELSIFNTNPQTLPVFHQFVTSKLGSSLCNIQTVVFEYHTCASLDVISDTLRCMPSVSDVCIRFSHDDTGVASESSTTQLGESIAALSKLSRLEVWFARNRLDMSVILHHLSQSPSKTLTHISFNYTHVGDAISHMGGIIPHLVSLSLWYASLDDGHITALCNILPNATCLERLGLSGNPNIGNNGLHTLFTHIYHCVRLTRLVIHATIDCHCSPLVKECVTAASVRRDADYKRIPAGEDIPVEACKIRLDYWYDATQSLLSISRNAATKSTDSQKPTQT